MRARSCFSLVLLATQSLAAQEVAWRSIGTPAGAPPGCSTRAAGAAVDSFFAAMRDADSARLARATAPVHRGGFTFSTGKFTPLDTFVVAHDLPELLKYARKRQQQHERITIQQVTFNYWRDSGLQFAPIYLTRTADDLGPAPHYGIGKGEYWCGRGISVLNTAPRPRYDPGPGGSPRLQASRRAPPNER